MVTFSCFLLCLMHNKTIAATNANKTNNDATTTIATIVVVLLSSVASRID